jgi:hypothetical protein
MKRVNFHITERQQDELRKISERTGLSVAELIRRAVDILIERESSKEDASGKTDRSHEPKIRNADRDKPKRPQKRK